jgi:hypothetical protein
VRRWLLPLAVFAVGVGLGLLVGWVLWPVQYYDTAPADLQADYRDEYVRLVALTYDVTGDLTAARRRLARLDADEPSAPLVDLTERLIDRGAAPEIIRPLAVLARDLGAETPPMAPYLEGGAS